MLNKKYYKYGTAPTSMRELFTYGLEQAKIVGSENIYDYSLGNPSIPAPASVNENIKRIVGSDDPLKLHGYSLASGFEETRQAVAANLNERFGCNAKASELFMTCGCAPALSAVAKALSSSPEDEFILIAPYFPEYPVYFTSGGAKTVTVPADTKEFQIDFDAFEAAVNEHSQAVILNSPNNPSGVVYTEESIRKVADILTRKSEEYGHPIYIIADEPYRELVYGGVKVPFIPNIYDSTIVCYSWSKSLSLAGERIGYIYVPEKCADSRDLYWTCAGAAREIGSVCPPTLIQKMIRECVNEMPDLGAYEENRNLLYNALTEYGYECAKPDGAFYLFVKAPNGDAKAYSEKAKLEYNLLVVPGDGFECPGYFRLSYCVAADMIRRSLPAFKSMIEAYN